MLRCVGTLVTDSLIGDHALEWYIYIPIHNANAYPSMNQVPDSAKHIIIH